MVTKVETAQSVLTRTIFLRRSTQASPAIPSSRGFDWLYYCMPNKAHPSMCLHVYTSITVPGLINLAIIQCQWLFSLCNFLFLFPLQNKEVGLIILQSVQYMTFVTFVWLVAKAVATI